MNKVIYVNLSGAVFQIEEDAYAMLQSYLEKLKSHFKKEESPDEIISDIESRIAEMFAKNPGRQACINKIHVQQVIQVMGNPADLDEDEESQPIVEEIYNERAYRKLFRNPEGRMLGGVCSGLASYFDLDPILVRIIFLILFFGFGGGFLIYIILWIAVPEAKTTADKLQMKGERVTISNIEKNIRDEFEHLKKNFNSDETKTKVRNAGKQAESVLKTSLRFSATILSKFIGALLLLIALGFISGIILASIGVFLSPLNTEFLPIFIYVFEETFFGYIFYIAILLTLLLPFIGLMLSSIRLIYGNLHKKNISGRFLSILWISSFFIALSSIIYIVVSLNKQVTKQHEITISTKDTLYINKADILGSSQKVNQLSIRLSDGFMGDYILDNRQLFQGIDLSIDPAEGKMVQVLTEQSCRGLDRETAENRLNSFQASLLCDSNDVLHVQEFFSLGEHGRLRGQRIMHQIKIPTGKVVAFDTALQALLDRNNIRDSDNRNIQTGIAYTMTTNGLFAAENIPTKLGTGEISQMFDFDSFNEIEIMGAFDVTISEQDKHIISITGKENDISDVQVKKEGNKISIKPNINLNELNKQRLQLTLAGPQFKKIEAKGAHKITINHKSGDVTYVLQGASVLSGKFNGNVLTIDNEGTNELVLQGNCQSILLKAKGANVLDLSKLSCNNAILHLEGANKSKIDASKKLEAKLEGTNLLQYKTYPGLLTEIKKDALSVVEKR
jgi:phage shock protein PspC (stress-responsive transcriptional regulator)